MHQYGYGVDRDGKTALRYYRKATEIGNHKVAYSKCGDFYYSKGDKRSAMICYKKASELGDLAAINSVGLMLE